MSPPFSQSQRQRVPGVVLGTISRCTGPSCWAKVGEREYGPLTSLVAAADTTPGTPVVLGRIDGDPNSLVVIGVVGGTTPAGGPGSAGNLRVQNSNPDLTEPGVWIQTGLGAGGADMTIWVETGG